MSCPVFPADEAEEREVAEHKAHKAERIRYRVRILNIAAPGEWFLAGYWDGESAEAKAVDNPESAYVYPDAQQATRAALTADLTHFTVEPFDLHAAAPFAARRLL